MTSIARLLLLSLLAAGTLAACAGSGLVREAHPTTLNGTVWQVFAVNGRPPIVGSEPTIALAEGRVTGSAGCNSYGGQYTYEPSTGAIAFSDMGMTAMACLEQGRGDFEALFSQAMNQVTAATIDPQGRLVLSGPAGHILLTVGARNS